MEKRTVFFNFVNDEDKAEFQLGDIISNDQEIIAISRDMQKAIVQYLVFEAKDYTLASVALIYFLQSATWQPK